MESSSDHSPVDPEGDRPRRALRIELRVLGVLRVGACRSDAAVERVLARPKQLALLAYLGVGVGDGFRTRDAAIGVFWPDVDEKRARHSLNQALYGLRRTLGPAAVRAIGDEAVRLDPERVWCDAVAFEREIVAGRREAALELCEGPLLESFHLRGCPDFERWLESERARLRRLAVEAGLALAREEGPGDPAAAIRSLRRLIRWNPWDEACARALMDLLRRVGDRSGALEEYASLCARLTEDLDIDPSPETQSLAAAIRLANGARADDGPAPPGAIRSEPGRSWDRAPGADPAPAPPSTGPAPRARQALTTPGGARPDAGVATPPLPPPPLSPSDPSMGSSRRRFATLVAAIAALLTLLTLRDRTLPRPGPTGPERLDAERSVRVVVLPFEVRGPERLQYLSEGLAALVGAKLDGAGPLRTVDGRAVVAFVEASEPAGSAVERTRAASERFDASLAVSGEVVAVGGRLTIRSTLHDDRGAALARVEGRDVDEATLIASVDELTRGLVAARYGTAADRLSRLAAITTSSLPALKDYLHGEHAFRRGRFVEARDAFARAATLDTTFALAHYRLSLATLWADVPDTLPFDAEARALRHSSRLAERDRDLLNAFLAWRRGEAGEAERRYRSLVARYPDDAEAWLQLAETLFHYNPLRGRPVGEARKPLERVVDLDPANWNARWHLALLAAGDGSWDELRFLVDRLESTKPEAGRAFQLRALEGFALGSDVVRAALERDLTDSHELDVYAVLWHVAVQLRDIDEAVRIARSLTDFGRLPLARSLGYENLAYLELARDRGEAARKAIRGFGEVDAYGLRTLELRTFAAVLPFRPGPEAELRALREEVRRWRPTSTQDSLRSTHLAALLDVAMRDTAAALAGAARLDRLAASASRYAPHSDGAAGIRARVAVLRGRPGEALRLLEESPVERWFGWATTSPFQSGALERFLRAELLEQAGRAEEALAWYASFGEHGVHDLVFLGPALLRTARIEEARGAPQAAAAARVSAGALRDGFRSTPWRQAAAGR